MCTHRETSVLESPNSTLLRWTRQSRPLSRREACPRGAYKRGINQQLFLSVSMLYKGCRAISLRVRLAWTMNIGH